MENKIDELFREKLEHHSVSPNAEVWQKMEANLVKKNSPTWWWRIAAVVLLVGGLLAAIVQTQNSTSQYPSTDLVEHSKNTDQLNPKPEQVITVPEKPKAINHIVKTNVSVKRGTKKIASDSSIKQANSLAQLNVVEESLKEIVVNNEAIPIAVNSIAATAELDKPIVLEFTIPSIDPVAVAQSQEKTNGIRKLFTKAKEIKNGEGGIDLYELTSKLFASANKQDKNNIN
jgi:hypothetical protein